MYTIITKEILRQREMGRKERSSRRVAFKQVKKSTIMKVKFFVNARIISGGDHFRSYDMMWLKFITNEFE